MKPQMATLIAGLSLAVPVWLGPQYLSKVVFFIPDPALIGFSWFWLVPLGSDRNYTVALVLAQFVPVLFFFGWNPRLFLGATRVPKRSYVLFAIATVLTVFSFRSSFSDGIGYQGPEYTYAFLGANVACVALLGLMFARNWNADPSFKKNLLLHWGLFAWLAWFAVPFLGAPVWP
jgi:hypothetical protein